ncbi:hypothetical protein EGR_04912 [Echinococcus granulosus]|uniref:Uncharacterized protein n=1 Tax=Echinococcus granulosus TaxID=6210 RepID=W6UPK5_ECHGR|nr:hypothetical protein EGR_04912 [Echinococcus granulosus]EUB60202.1 hypothetical protein EGR_04912 [Echinococcus granulosus]
MNLPLSGRQLCEFDGLQCNGSVSEDACQRRRGGRRSDSGDKVTGVCIGPCMRCDGVVDYWLDERRV